MKRNKYSNYLLVLLAAFLGFLTFRENPYVGVCTVLSLFLSAFYDRHLTIALYVFASFLGVNLSTIEVLGELIIVMVVSISIIHFNNERIRHLMMVVAAFALSILIGAIFYVVFEFDSFFLYIFKLVIMIIIAQVVVNTNDKLIIRAVLLSAIIMTMITGYLYVIGDTSIYTEYSNRLTYNGNVKDLATAIVIPVIYTLDKLIDYKNLKNKITVALYGAAFGICLAILLLTYARGVLIGLAVATLALVLVYSKKNSLSHILIFAILAFLIIYLVDSLQLNSNVMFGNIEGGDGRTDIYSNFYKYMVELGGATLFWGLGTGSPANLAVGNPHSVLFAHYFYYGVFGALFIIYIIVSTLIALLRCRKIVPFYFALFIQTVVMYSAHGTYSEPRFWLLIGLCTGVALKGQANLTKYIKGE